MNNDDNLDDSVSKPFRRSSALHDSANQIPYDDGSMALSKSEARYPWAETFKWPINATFKNKDN